MQETRREDKVILRIIIIGLTLLSIIAGVAILTQRAQDSAQRELVRALELEKELNNLLTAIQAGESGQRGFLLTLDTNYLRTYKSGRVDADPTLDRILNNLNLNSIEEKSVENIRRLKNLKFEELGTCIRLAKTNEILAALNYVKTDYGKKIMDSIRIEIDVLVGNEQKIVTSKKSIAAQLFNFSNALLVFGSLVLFVLAIYIYLIINPLVKELVVSRNREHEQNKVLEEKNEQLQHFAYIASHDLKEPLRTVTSFIEIFQEEYEKKLDDDAQEYFNFINKATDRMRALIEGLLAFSRIGKAQNFEQTDLNMMLKEIKEDLSLSINEKQAVIKLDPLHNIACSKVELRQVFQNLISNGLKFCPTNRSPVISVFSVEKPDHIQFVVQDNGIGISKEQKSKIFNMFSRLHLRSEYEGQGIGLAFCKKIVELHGGKIWVESLPGQGSSFFFTVSKHLKK